MKRTPDKLKIYKLKNNCIEPHPLRFCAFSYSNGGKYSQIYKKWRGSGYTIDSKDILL